MLIVLFLTACHYLPGAASTVRMFRKQVHLGGNGDTHAMGIAK